MNAYTIRLRAALWWIVPAVLLVFAIGWETDWGAALRKAVPPETPIVPKAVDTALLPEFVIDGGVAAHTETVQRTLFNPTRRPAPVSPQDGANARLQRGQFALAGTTITDGKSTALLREVAGNKTRRVQQGDFINGMLVAKVAPDRVRLAVDDEWEELVLKVATNPRPTTAPAPVATAPPVAAPPIAAPVGAAQPVPVQRPVQAAPSPQREAAAQSLAERRRAARAAQAANNAAQAGAAGAAADGAAGTGATQSMTFDDVNRAYQQRNPGAAKK